MHEHFSGNKFRRSQIILDSFIQSIDKLPPKSNIVLLCRESKHFQELNGNLVDQVSNCSELLISRGHKIVFIHDIVASGKRPLDFLYPAIEAAWKNKAVIVAETIDRIMRPDNYDSSESPNAQLSV